MLCGKSLRCLRLFRSTVMLDVMADLAQTLAVVQAIVRMVSVTMVRSQPGFLLWLIASLTAIARAVTY